MTAPLAPVVATGGNVDMHPQTRPQARRPAPQRRCAEATGVLADLDSSLTCTDL